MNTPRHATILALTGRKGGIGKTTSCKELCYAFARARALSVDWDRDYRVLGVEMDGQGNLSKVMGVFAERGEPTVASVLYDGADIRDVIRTTATPGLDILPANDELEEHIGLLYQQPDSGLYLRYVLEEVRGDYDLILIDCPPSIGLQWQMAMRAADAYLMPVHASHMGKEGLKRMIDTIQVHQQDWELAPLLGIALLMVNRSTKVGDQIVPEFRAEYGDLVFRNFIRQNQALDDAHQAGKTIYDFNPRASGASDYRGLAREVLDRLKERGMLRAAIAEVAA